MINDRLTRALRAGEKGLDASLVNELPGPWWLTQGGNAPYDLSDKALVGAIHTALLLGQPLILAGEPGVGKTSLAKELASRLALPLHQAVQVKSSTAGIDLFYSFDEVARFRDATSQPKREPPQKTRAMSRYVRFSSLGRAILWSAGPDCEVALGSVPAEEILGTPTARETLTLGELFPHEFILRKTAPDGAITSEPVQEQTRSMVLLDELDKAPRDAPNDILGELETMSFRIAELDLQITAKPAHWPILLISSNSERSLPDAFLRRCVFHWITFPEREALMRIVAHRIGEAYDIGADDPLLKSAIDLFMRFREESENKKPATAELIAFLIALRQAGFDRLDKLDEADPNVTKLYCALMKTKVDREAAG